MLLLQHSSASCCRSPPVPARRLACGLRRRLSRCSCQAPQQQQASAAAADAAAAGPRDAAARPQWASYVSRRINLELAVEEAVEGALKGQQPGQCQPPTLAIVFLSSAYVAEYEQLITQLRRRVPSLQYIVGSTGYGVIGSTEDGAEEIEHAPALSLALSSLPGCHISITHVTGPQLPDGDAPPDSWAKLVDVQLHSPHPTSFVMLAEPEFPQLQELTAGLDFAFPAANKIGGLVSAGKLSPERAMFAWSSSREQEQQQLEQEQQQPEQQQAGPGQFPPLLRTGAVVLALQGPVELELLVAQGCRPLSSSIYTVDSVAEGGPLVLSLRDARGRQLTPVEALQRELEQVASNRAELLVLLRNMALGLMPEVLRAADRPPPEAHDFLIRGMALSKAGFMVVGDAVRVGQSVRFMVRDREGAQQDLQAHCLAYKRRELAATLGGSLGPQQQPAQQQPAQQQPAQQQPAQQQPAQPQQPQPQPQQQPVAGQVTQDAVQQGEQPQPPKQPQEQPQPQPQQPQPPGGQQRAFGMLLFSCNGRGTDLYGAPSWDSRTLSSYIPVPCSGFMCNGEIASFGGSSHIHGFTCAAAVLRAVEPAPEPATALEGAAAAGSSSSSGKSSGAAGSAQLQPDEREG